MGELEDAELDVVAREPTSALWIYRRPAAAVRVVGAHDAREADEPTSATDDGYDADEAEGDVHPKSRRDSSKWLFAAGVESARALLPTASVAERQYYDDREGKSLTLAPFLPYQYVTVTVLFAPSSFRQLTQPEAALRPKEQGLWAVFHPSGPKDGLGNPADILLNIGFMGGSFRTARYISRHVLPVSKFERVPFAKLYWASDGVAEPNLRHKLVPGSELVYTWHQVPASHRQELRIQRYLGTLNGYTVDGFPPGSLRFDGFSMRTYRPYHGVLLCDFFLYFNYVDRLTPALRGTVVGAYGDPVEALGHNYLPVSGKDKSSDDVLYRFVADADGRPPYRYADWAYIFLPYDEL